jgi:hypothetical protein
MAGLMELLLRQADPRKFGELIRPSVVGPRKHTSCGEG